MTTKDKATEAQSPPCASDPDEDDGRIVRLSAECQRRFAELLIDPPEPSPGFLRAIEAHRRLIGEP